MFVYISEINPRFLGWVDASKVWGTVSVVRKKFTVGRNPQFSVIFQQFAVNVLKIWKGIEIFLNKAILIRKFLFFASTMWKEEFICISG